MATRLIFGLLKGVLIGGVLAALVVKGLGLLTMTGLTAYALAVGAGTIAGLVAGKPIWASGAKLEALLKAIAGAGLGALALFALRRWVHLELDLTAQGLGQGAVSELVVTALPAVTSVLALLFELDNTEQKEAPPPKGTSKKQRVEGAKARAPDELEADDAEEARRRARR
jgi:hypothetical protein